MAQAAITNMDAKSIEGSYISVRLANRDKDKGIHNKPSSNLYVANLPQKVTELDLRIIFSRYGDIHSLRVLKYPNTGMSQRYPNVTLVHSTSFVCKGCCTRSIEGLFEVVWEDMYEDIV